jgi:hypothetical protein
VNKLLLGQVFLRVLHFLLSLSFHRCSPYSYIIWEMNSSSVCGRSSETYFDPIDVNNNMNMLGGQNEGKSPNNISRLWSEMCYFIIHFCLNLFSVSDLNSISVP